MGQHYTNNTVSVSRYCKKCSKNTQHAVSGRRAGHCLECFDELERKHKAEMGKPKVPIQSGFKFGS